MSAWTETQVPETRCPYCDGVLDAASSANGATPSPGDLSVCIHCASALTFDAELRLRVLTQAEMRELDPEIAKVLRRYMRAVRSADRRLG